MSQNSRLKVLLAKIEGTYGTDTTPTASADAVLARMITATPVELTYEERTLVRAYLGSFDQLASSSLMKLEVECELTGYSAAGVATAGLDALLRACGLAETVVASTSVSYAPVSTGQASATIYYYQGGILHKMVGARGTLAINMEQRKIPTIKFTMTGLDKAVTDVGVPTPVVSAYPVPLIVSNANTTGLSIHGFTTAALAKFSFDLNNTVVHRTLVNQAEMVLITDRAPKGTIEIEMTTVAAKDWMATVKTATLGAFAMTHGPTGNQAAIAAPQMQLLNPKYSDMDNIVMLGMDLGFIPQSGNDEVSLAMQ
jgi:hypothetical protein